MQPIAELEAAARQARAAVQAVLHEAERSSLMAAIERYAQAQALVLTQLVLTEVVRQLAAGTLNPSAAALESIVAGAIAATARDAPV